MLPEVLRVDTRVNFGSADVGITDYRGPQGLYFRRVLSSSVALARRCRPSGAYLDFGSGYGEMKKMFPEEKIVNYDKEQSLSEICDWKTFHGDVVIANHVFYRLKTEELLEIRNFFFERGVPIVFSDSEGRTLNMVLAKLAGNPRALQHKMRGIDDTIEIMKERYEIGAVASVFGLSRVVLLNPRECQ